MSNINDELTIILGRLEEDVYTRAEAKARIHQLIREARIDELKKYKSETGIGYFEDKEYLTARLRELEGTSNAKE